MKRILSIVLSVLSVLSVFAIGSVYIKNEQNRKEAFELGNNVAQMCAQYDDYSELSQNEDKTILTRLIVKSDGKIDEYGAIDSVYGSGYAFLQYKNNEDAQKAKDKYEQSGYLTEYDSLVTAQEVRASSYEYSSNWAYDYVDSQSVIDYYKLKVKPTINVAVVDSGINYNHKLFKNRIVRTYTNFSSDKIQNDEIDNFGHGTMVAGVIALSTPSNVKIHSYKTMGKNGGTSSGIITACEYILELSSKPDIINFSVSLPPNEIWEEQINTLVDEGVTVVVSAGNDGAFVFRSPERMENVITVGATDINNKPTRFSNYGVEVDISAPGECVYTATKEGSYNYVDGTSFSSPMVAGASAIVLMEHRNYTPKQVQQELISTAVPFKRDGIDYMYGSGIVNFSNLINGTRCKEVTANYEGGVYRDDINVELKCANTLVDIYYTTDGTLPTETNGTKYTEPIQISESTRIIASAYARAGTPFHSTFTTLDYYILKNGESEFVINDQGRILNYLGNDTDIVVPDEINGIIPTEINKKSFMYNNTVKSISLPDSVTKIGEYAFRGTNIETVLSNGVQSLGEYCFEGSKLSKIDFPNLLTEESAFNNTPITSAYLPKLENIFGGFKNCTSLSSIYIPEVLSISNEAFSGCTSLTQELVLPKLNSISDKGFSNSYFKSIILPSCEKIYHDYAFENAKAEEISIGNTKTYSTYTFKNCNNLKVFYAPKLTSFPSKDFSESDKLSLVFVPSAESIAVDVINDITIYCASLTSSARINNPNGYNCNIICPEYSPMLNQIDKSLYNHILCDDKGVCREPVIRSTDNGLRFGFEFNEACVGFDFKKFAPNIEYGFVYLFDSSYGSYNDYQKNSSLRAEKNNVFVRQAVNRTTNDGISSFNAVFTGIDESNINDVISVRGYFCVDGMYFYSPVVTKSLSEIEEYEQESPFDNDFSTEFNHSHYFVFVNWTSGTINYKCSDCNMKAVKNKSIIEDFPSYVNSVVTANDNSMYYDFVTDGIINAKDYAKFKIITK